MKYRIKKCAKQVLVRMIHFARLRPGIKAWALKRLEPFPVIEARLRRLIGSPLAAYNGTVVPTVIPVTCLQLNQHARNIYAELAFAKEQHVAGNR